jgi:hypothetical protein
MATSIFTQRALQGLHDHALMIRSSAVRYVSARHLTTVLGAHAVHNTMVVITDGDSGGRRESRCTL